MGAAEGLREAIGVPVGSIHQERRARLAREVQTDIGDDVFHDKVAEGRGLQFEQALELAIETSTDLASIG